MSVVGGYSVDDVSDRKGKAFALVEDEAVWTEQRSLDGLDIDRVYLEAWYFTWVTISSTGYINALAISPRIQSGPTLKDNSLKITV